MCDIYKHVSSKHSIPFVPAARYSIPSESLLHIKSLDILLFSLLEVKSSTFSTILVLVALFLVVGIILHSLFS